MNVPELDQGPTCLCWAYSVAECFDSRGKTVSPFDIYAQVKGVPFSPPGETASFDELRKAVQAAAAMTKSTIKFFGSDGVINDLATFDQALRDGNWLMICGVAENDLQSGQRYDHFFVPESLYFDCSGQPRVRIADSYRRFDGSSDDYPLSALHQSMVDNWDPNCDALAFQIEG